MLGTVKTGKRDTEILVQVVYSDRRTVSLEIKPDLSVTLRAPRLMRDKDILAFVDDRQSWLFEKHQELRRRKAESPAGGIDIREAGQFREKAGTLIKGRVALFAQRMHVDYGRITVRDQKTRWGSCSVKGNLNFNWRLAAMPPEILDYVVVHELAHRRYMNHSGEFWAEVEKILPNYKELRQWLKKHGSAYGSAGDS